MSDAATAETVEAPRLIPAILEAIGRGFTPDPDLKPSEWVARKLVLRRPTTSRPGPVNLDLIPYARDILDALGPRSPYSVVVWMTSSQVAKTTVGIAWTFYNIDQRPGPLLIVQPTTNVVKRFAKQKIEPTIAATPCLRAKIRPARTRDSGNTRLTKEFPNGLLHMAGANSPAELAEMSARDTHLDEVDRFPHEVGDEGDPIEVASFRQETYGDGKTFMTSTPTTAGLSRIELALEQCDVEMEFHVPCLSCQHQQPFVFEQLRWPEGNPEEAAYECVACHALIPYAKKRVMVRAGTWAPIRDNGRKGSIGFRIWQAYSLIGKTSWALIAQKYEKAKGKPALMRAFTNLVLGRTYTEEHEAPEWRRIYDRRERYEIGTVPKGVVFLTAGADVQGDRIELEIVGWGRGKESWSIAYHVLPGEPAQLEDQASPLRRALDSLLASDIPCVGGGMLRIRVLGIDMQYATQHVCSWARLHPQAISGAGAWVARQPGTVVAMKGMEGWRPVVTGASRADTGTKRKGMKLWPIGTWAAKREIYDFLRLLPPTEEETAQGVRFPPGYCHFPEYGEEYFKQLTAARYIERPTKRGYRREAWEKDPARRDEALDTRVYARAAASIYGLDRFFDRDWTRLEAEVPKAIVAEERSAAPIVRAVIPAKPAPGPRRFTNSWLAGG